MEKCKCRGCGKGMNQAVTPSKKKRVLSVILGVAMFIAFGLVGAMEQKIELMDTIGYEY